MKRRSQALLAALGMLALGDAQAFKKDDALKAHDHSMGFATHSQTAEPSLKDKTGLGERLIRTKTVQSPRGFSLFGNKHQLSAVQVDRVDGDVRLLSGKLNYSLETMDGHRDHLAGIISELGLQNVSLKYNEQSSMSVGDLITVHYDRTHEGRPVAEAYMILRYKKGQLIQIVNNLFSKADVQPFGAVETAKLADRIEADAGVRPTSFQEYFRVEMGKKAYQLTPSVTSEVTLAEPKGTWVYSLDVTSGRIIEIKSKFHFTTGTIQGEVFPRTVTDPKTTVALRNLAIVNGSTKAYTDVSGNYSIDANGALAFGLTTKYFTMNNKSGNNAAVKEASAPATYNLTWADANSTMAERTAGHHLEIVREWAKSFYAAAGKAFPWLDQPLPVNVNIADSCNAFYDYRSVNFFNAGGGCANSGQIADVMYHEWGHALDDKVAGGISDGAFSEGIGDICSMILTKSPLLGPAFFNDGSPVRENDTDKIYPRDRGEVHDEGQIIGSTYWDLYTAIRANYSETDAYHLMSKLFLVSILSSPKYTDNYAALLAVDDDNGNLADGTPNYCLINKAFAQHGLAESDQTCLEKLNIQSGSFNKTVIQAGDTVTFDVTIKNRTAQAINGVAVSLESRTADLRILSPAKTVDFAAQSSVTVAGLSFEIGGNAACNSVQKFAVVRTYGNNVEKSEVPLIIGKGESATAANASGNVNAQIPDNNATGIKSTLNVNATNRFVEGAVVVNLNIGHTYRGDLKVALVSPSGKKVMISDREGRSNKDIRGKFVLDGFAGEKANGDWTLTVSDHSDQDTGTLENWSLEVPAYVSTCM